MWKWLAIAMTLAAVHGRAVVRRHRRSQGVAGSRLVAGGTSGALTRTVAVVAVAVARQAPGRRMAARTRALVTTLTEITAMTGPAACPIDGCHHGMPLDPPEIRMIPRHLLLVTSLASRLLVTDLAAVLPASPVHHALAEQAAGTVSTHPILRVRWGCPIPLDLPVAILAIPTPTILPMAGDAGIHGDAGFHGNHLARACAPVTVLATHVVLTDMSAMREDDLVRLPRHVLRLVLPFLIEEALHPELDRFLRVEFVMTRFAETDSRHRWFYDCDN